VAQTLPKYTPAQTEAIACLDEPRQIIACAGSGKDGSSDSVPSADYRLAEVPPHASPGFRNSLVNIWAGRGSRSLQEVEALIA
jgi:hypothetical protein